MKKYLLLLLLMPFFCYGQIVKTKTMYKAYTAKEAQLQRIVEEIKTYNTAGQVIQITTMGIVNDKLATNDTVLILGTHGQDSMAISFRDVYDFTKPFSIEKCTYTNNQLTLNNITNYSIANGVLDSIVQTNIYQYLSKNKILKTTIANGNTTIKTYMQDANGLKLLDRYHYKLDKQNRLVEKYSKTESKKTARIEKYAYYPNGNRKEFKIIQGGKIKSITTYKYDTENKMIAENTKSIIGKKFTTDTITYQYTNGNCTSETAHIHGETDTMVTYSYTFY